jgi:hypothetical protein
MAGANANVFLSHLDSAFDPDAEAWSAFRLNVQSGPFTWEVAGDVLTVTPASGVPSTFTLSQNTLGTLTDALVEAGFVVTEFANDEGQGALSAAVLMDGSGSANDPLRAYGSLLWSIGEALGVELSALGDATTEALLCAVMETATSVWLDLWGSYFGITRLNGEEDDVYARRIVVEVLRPRCNNTAIALALQELFVQDVEVVDAVETGAVTPAHDGLISFDGTHYHNATVHPLYGLFDVQVGYDLLNGGDPAAFVTVVTAIVERMRAAGTYLRNVALGAGTISDSVAAPVDGDMPLAVGVPLTDTPAAPTDDALSFASSLALGTDTVAAPSETLTITITSSIGFVHDGTYKFDGTKTHNAGTQVTEQL